MGTVLSVKNLKKEYPKFTLDNISFEIYEKENLADDKGDAIVTNPMMNANQAYLAYILLVFALFNWIFLGRFVKTAYKIGPPFILFIVISFLLITAAEVLHHIPGLEFLNDTDTAGSPTMWIILAAAFVIYAIVTAISCRVAMKRFERVDM